MTFSLRYCPTRRKPIAYPVGQQLYRVNANWSTLTVVGKTDYVANMGDCNYTDVRNLPVNVPWSLTQGDTFTNWIIGYTGICYLHSVVKVADVKDGTSNTYMLGEKPIDPDYYFNSVDGGDDWSWDTGFQDDIVRAVAYYNGVGQPYTYFPPMRDTPGYDDYSGFGSARHRREHGPVRRLRAADQLFDQPGSESPTREPHGRAENRREELLTPQRARPAGDRGSAGFSTLGSGSRNGCSPTAIARTLTPARCRH